jgi:hypothetical protein
MKQELVKQQTLGIIRHALTFVGGIIVMKGLVDEATVAEISGLAMTFIGAIWSVWDKRKKSSDI